MKRGHNEETRLKEQEEDREVLIEGEVIRVREGRGIMALVRTEDFSIEVRIFHPTAIQRRYLVRGAIVKLTGRLTRWHGKRCLIHPRIVF